MVLIAGSLLLRAMYPRDILLANNDVKSAAGSHQPVVLTTSTASCFCGDHGSCLVDRCICDPGHEGRFCNNSIPLRNAKCRFDPEQDLCWNLPGVGRFRMASSKRQQQAFSCETAFWETTSVPKRNHDQVLAFQHFQALPKDLGAVLEIGCGPYTKIRLILETRPDLLISHVTLLDPLMREYTSNPKIETSYPNSSLQVNGRTVPTTLVAAQGEEPLSITHYDTVILVNTLEHCSNAVVVLNNVYQSLKAGGILIFGESFAREMELLSSDACHPIQLIKTFFMEYLGHYRGGSILSPRHGEAVEGVEHGGTKRSLFAIVRK